MSAWDAVPPGAYLPAELVLSQLDAAVVVTDRRGNLLYANAYAARLFDFPGEAAELTGRSVLSLGFERGELGTAAELARQVRRGRGWDGTFGTVRQDGSRVFVRAQAVPLRHPSGPVDGIVIIAREATRRSSRRERDRIALLDRIGERLAGSLELSLTLRHVAETLVPQFADHCAIDLLLGDKLVRRAQISAVGWPPPDSSVQVGDQVTYPEGHFCQQAMKRLDVVLVEDVSRAHYPAPAGENRPAGREAGLASIVAAPLYARGQLLGVMSLALSRLSGREERHYDADDRDFLGAIASRVAIAIDNAMLFEEERRTALAFQTSLLPQHLPTFDGIDVAWRYVPAKPLETRGHGIQTQVGGDWYDLIPLSAGRVGIVIGDVEGRGARAAAVMGQLRAALRAFAQDDKPPGEILRKLDDWCRTLGPSPGDGSPGEPDPPTVSCTYFVYDAWSRTLRFANAGHDAPLLIAGGTAAPLEMEHKGLLLGVRSKGVAGAPTYPEETRRLPPGATLVLYTDGLTDRRQRADGSGHYTETEATEMLRAAVGRVAAEPPQVIARAAEQAVPGDIDDDMAIVVVQTSAADLDSWECSFPAEAIRVSEARRLAQATFARWGMRPEQAELTCLLVSEVVTNVVLHTGAPARHRPEFMLEPAGGGGPLMPLVPGWDGPPLEEDLLTQPPREFTLRLRRGASSVWVEVFDSDLRLPRIRSAGETDEGGRGLYLVDQLASRWGSRPTEDGKAVWFEMAIDGLGGG